MAEISYIRCQIKPWARTRPFRESSFRNIAAVLQRSQSWCFHKLYHKVLANPPKYGSCRSLYIPEQESQLGPLPPLFEPQIKKRSFSLRRWEGSSDGGQINGLKTPSLLQIHKTRFHLVFQSVHCFC